MKCTFMHRRIAVADIEISREPMTCEFPTRDAFGATLGWKLRRSFL